MRLIDADALKEAFEEVYPLATNEMGGAVNKRIYDIIDDAPTIEERPKGKWEFVQYDANPNIGNWHCTNCRKIAIAHTQYNFCPFCGAVMRGEV